MFDPAVSLPNVRLHVRNSIQRKLNSVEPFGSLASLLGGSDANVPVTKFVAECSIDSPVVRKDLSKLLSYNADSSGNINVAHAVNILA
jgi:hypothetical protein